MPVDEKVAKWLGDISGLEIKSDQAKTAMEKRQEGFELIGQLDLADIKAGMTYTMTEVPNSKWAVLKDKLGLQLKTMSSMDSSRDAMKEIDTWHDLPGLQGLPAEDVARVLKALQKVMATRDKLVAIGEPYVVQDEVNNRLISEDLFMPLVRQGIIPENAVPDAFSEVARTFQGASEVYQERLTQYSEELTDGKKLMEKLNLGFSVVDSLGKVASGTLGVVANSMAVEQGLSGSLAAHEHEQSVELLQVKSNLDMALTCLTATKDIANNLVDQKDVFGVVDSLNVMVKGILAKTVGSDVAKLVSNIITASSRSAKLGKTVFEKGDLEAAFIAIGDAVEAGINAGTNSEATSLSAGLKTGIYGLGAAAKAASEGDPKAGLSLALKAAKEGAQIGTTEFLAAKKQEALDAAAEKYEGDQEKIDEVQGSISTHFSTSGGGLSDLESGVQDLIKGKVSNVVDKEKAEEIKQDFDQQQQMEMLELRSKPDQEFEQLLANGFSEIDDDLDDDPEATQEKLELQAVQIEKLIALIKKDQMALDTAKQIITGGTAFVANFVPAVGIVSVGTQLMFSMIEAANHMEQLEIWTSNLEAASKSGSVQAEAIRNRFKLENSQTLKANALMLLKAVELVGKVLEVAGGPAAPVGLAVSGAAMSSGELLKLCYTVKTEVEMRGAWSVYKKALATPGDRKLPRTALRDNPTLSKYAIAYGALEENNPIAKKALKSCGLNERTLAHEGTDVHKVVSYLETLYREDPILLKAVLVEASWHPAGQNAELESMSWQRFLNAAKEATPPFVIGDVSKITAAMGTFETAHGAVKGKLDLGWEIDGDLDPATFSDTENAAKALISALGSFKPVDNEGQAHKEMLDYANTLIAKAQYVVNEIARTRRDIAETPGAPNAAKSSLQVNQEAMTADGSDKTIVTAKVLDAKELPVLGQSVTLTVGGTGNTVGEPVGTDALGLAEISFTTTAAGDKEVSAAVGEDSVVITEKQTVTAEEA